MARIYTDGGEAVKTKTHVKCSTYRVRAGQKLKFRLQPSGGAAVHLQPVGTENADPCRRYNGGWL